MNNLEAGNRSKARRGEDQAEGSPWREIGNSGQVSETANSPTRDFREAGANSLPLSENSARLTHKIHLGPGIFLKSFLGLYLRDLRVLSREFLPFILRVGMQPLLFLFVFTFILPRMASGNPMAAAGVDFGTILLPGLMAVAIMFSGIAAVALPLSSEFGITREIDDRVMCPVPLWAVALEKVCFSADRKSVV